MPSLNDNGQSGMTHWRSLEHLADTEEFREFLHREFPAGASEMLESTDRRQFLKIMGASMALAGLGIAGCRRWPDEKIVPHAKRPEHRDPGVPVSYATCMELGGVARGVLVKSFDGRPVKVEGNPDHPTSLGAADHFAQASVLDLYDPDRSRGVLKDGSASSYEDFEAWANEHFSALANNRGRGLAVLSERIGSPSMIALKKKFLQRFPEARWVEYEPVSEDHAIAGSVMAFGSAMRTQLDLNQAKTIVAFDADILGVHPDAVRNIRGFANSRRAVDEDTHAMSRLYAVESDLSLTGANADVRLALPSEDVQAAVLYLAHHLLGAEAISGDVPELTPEQREILDAIVVELEAHHGTGVVAVGSRQPAEVHYLAHLINEHLGNVGKTIAYTPMAEATASIDGLSDLAQNPPSTLVMIGGNPAYSAPNDLNLAGVIGAAAHAVHLSDAVDETSTLCDWHINRAHYLEAWGDGTAYDGTYTLGQPLIEPMFKGASAIELIAQLAGDDVRDGEAIVRRTSGLHDDKTWRAALHDGFIKDSALATQRSTASRGELANAVERIRTRIANHSDGFELVFAAHPSLYDGRFANNGWLQELPDSLTKLTWDNAVIMSPALYEQLGLTYDGTDKSTTMVKVSVGGKSITAAAYRMPGLPIDSVTLHLGYGRTFDGRICAGSGFDFGALRTSEAMGFIGGASIEAVDERYVLATTQDHHTIDVNTVGGEGVQERLGGLFREADAAEYAHHPEFATHRVHVPHRLSMWEERNLDDGQYAWGMSIDLNTCVGCNACIVACQAENNIPIVGKDQVKRGREMHWIRVDRYFSFAKDGAQYDPNHMKSVALQPVVCMHCENAPCEQVCPVAATVHDKDGLNVMVYNRCIGTRYCSNNCPYKVRRFNYFDYHRRAPARDTGLMHVEPEYYTKRQATPDELKQMQFNPEVTVRMRGVMEKCSFCIQRIADAKITAKNEFVQQSTEVKEQQQGPSIEIPDGTITPACAQTCPAQAIRFGDLMDQKAQVTKQQDHRRSYEMLEELNVKARTKYMAKIRNPFVTKTGDGHEAEPEAGGH